MARRTQTSCSRMSQDIQRLGSIASDVVGARKNKPMIRGSIFGPKDNTIFYTWKCVRESKQLPGGCGVFEITREGPGSKGLKSTATVGNFHGLMKQLSRDIVRAWGCKPSETSGFEGTRKRRRR